jgi:hypothetical protein
MGLQLTPIAYITQLKNGFATHSNGLTQNYYAISSRRRKPMQNDSFTSRSWKIGLQLNSNGPMQNYHAA